MRGSASPGPGAHARRWGKQALVGAREIADLAWPSTCVGCGHWGLPWCDTCEGMLVGASLGVRPGLAPHLVVHAAEPFEGPLRRAITAFKDDGRRDARDALVPLARRALAEAVAHAVMNPTDPSASPTTAGDDSQAEPLRSAARRGIVLVPVPSSRSSVRTRGRRPLAEIAQGVRVGTSVVDGSELLRHRGNVRDQSRLTLTERARNVASAFVVPTEAAARLSTMQPLVVLFDDVVTSGATLGSAHRALTQAGAAFVVCAAIAATPLDDTGRSFR